MTPSAEAIEKCMQFSINIVAKYYIVELIESDIKSKDNTDKEYSDYLKVNSLISGIVDANTDIIKQY